MLVANGSCGLQRFAGGACVPTVSVGMYATQAPSPALLRRGPSPARGEGWGIALGGWRIHRDSGWRPDIAFYVGDPLEARTGHG